MGKGQNIQLPIEILLKGQAEANQSINEVARNIGELIKKQLETNNIPFLKTQIQGLKSFDTFLRKNGISLKQFGDQLRFIGESPSGIGFSGSIISDEDGNKIAKINSLNAQRASITQQLSYAFKELASAKKQAWALEDIGATDTKAYKEIQLTIGEYQKNISSLTGSIKNADLAEQASAQQVLKKNQHLQQQMELTRQATLERQKQNAQAKIDEENTNSYIATLKKRLSAEEKLKTLEKQYSGTDNAQTRKGLAAQKEYVEILRKKENELLNLVKGTESYRKKEDEIIQLEAKYKAEIANTNVQLQKHNSLLGTFKNTFKMVVQSGLSWRVFSLFTRGVTNAINTVKELDKSLTNLQIVTNGTTFEAEQMLDTYNKIAIEMGSTTQQVADASIEWLRQGYTASEAAELTKNSMILSKVGAIESAQATEYLTSAIKGYRKESSEALSIIDKLTSIDLVAVTLICKISTAVHIM